MATYDEYAQDASLTERAGRVAGYAGAGVSLALMGAIGVWGYGVVMRDVTGVPVVRAMEGAMRVAPENPGGEIAAHRGLAVNAVAAVGEAAPPEDRLVLAPATTDLAEEDIEAQPMAEAGEVEPLDIASEDVSPTALTDPDAPVQEGPLDADDILALADRITAGATPMAPLDEGAVVQPALMVDGEEITSALEEAISADGGPATSLRPVARVVRTAAAAQAAPAAAAEPGSVEVARADPPSGTKLVQLGAFPTAEAAAEAWTRLLGRHGQYLVGHDRLIQEASSGGQVFYRLRAQGFVELADARRLCAALEAAGAECIPVVIP